MNRRFFRLLICLLAFTISLSFLMTGCTTIDVASLIGSDEMNVETFWGSYIINESDLTQVTTLSSYVFIAEVISYERTEYLNNEKYSPVTFYKIRVKENIKGALIKDEDIIFKKDGGLIRGTNTFLVCEGDVLPMPGKTYLFSAQIFENDLYSCMPNMVVEITADEKDYLNDETVKKYIEACKTVAEGVENGNKYKSRYDAGGN